MAILELFHKAISFLPSIDTFLKNIVECAGKKGDKICQVQLFPVSYTHLDVYKRQT